MCLIIDTNEHTGLIPKIAKQDIFAYKVLLYSSNRKEFYTPYMKVTVDITKEFKCMQFQNFPELTTDSYNTYFQLGVKNAIHLYSDIQMAFRCAKWHTVTLVSNNNSYIFACVYNVIIPKGNKYWIGIHGDICTESISFKDMVAVFCDSFVNTGRDSTFLQKECIALLRDGVNEDILLRFFYSIDVEKIIREYTEAELGILEPSY